MDPRLEPLAAVLAVNTLLFLNCLDGVTDEDALRRVDHRTNSMGFIAAHLVGARAFAAGAVGGDGTDPFAALLGSVSSIEQVESLPTLAEIREAWARVTRHIEAALDGISSEALDAEAKARFPIGDPSVLGMVAFLAQHDSYHIGQLAFLRKHLGYGAMSYHKGDAT
ncbi:MAG: hypothetical protein AMXMBFR53_31450 [Gemmatimonadota bacterium]